MATSKPPKPPGQYDVGYGKPPVKASSSRARAAIPVVVEKASPPPKKRL